MKNAGEKDNKTELVMVNVADKPITRRLARAQVIVYLDKSGYQAAKHNRSRKGELLNTARLAGIQAAKRTGDLIPLCHHIPLDHVEIDFRLDDAAQTVTILATASAHARTGVEMEALTACAVAALTLYDMLKAVQKNIRIGDLVLLEKKGGRSGRYVRTGS